MTTVETGRDRRPTLVTILLRSAHAMVGELVARMAAAGYPDIRPADSRVFENLDPNGTRLTELAARAQMTHQAMGELVASLEVRGYVERRPDPADRRARLVCFTPRGRAMMRLALAELDDIESTWLRRVEREPPANLRSALASALNGDGRAGNAVSAGEPPRRRS